jgi:hypothetical protein
MMEPIRHVPVFVFSLDDEGVQLNMDYVCPQCNMALRDHLLEIWTEDMPSKIVFSCQEVEEDD